MLGKRKTRYHADVKQAEKWLEQEPDSLEKRVFVYQLKRYKNMIS